jgi:hypothetical protein
MRSVQLEEMDGALKIFRVIVLINLAAAVGCRHAAGCLAVFRLMVKRHRNRSGVVGKRRQGSADR